MRRTKNKKILGIEQSRYFVGNTGTPVLSHCDEEWTKWEVGESKTRKRICLTNSEKTARLICDALEKFKHEK